MEFQHFLHPHVLSSLELEEKDEKPCEGCWDIIVGPAYWCRECGKFGMHKSCAELPPQIQKDSFHPHPLRFKVADGFVCDACGRLTAIVSYRCMYCEFKLDFKCAVAIFNDENVEEEAHQGTTIHHFCHRHRLTRCVFSSRIYKLEITISERSWGLRKLKCVACKQEIQGTLYICITCRFPIHESCMNEMPRQVQRSPFHPHHVLHPGPFPYKRGAGRRVRCYGCSKKIKGFGFYCNKCDVNLHVSCAKYRTRVIKHSCHPHDLLQLGKSVIHDISCDACGEGCNDSCFSCKKCDFSIHPQCIPLPSSFTHKRHLHPLALVTSFVEDDSRDYCCDMCETERNPELEVYYCEECNFIAHIDCVLSEILEPMKKILIDLQREEENFDNRSLEKEERVHHETIQRNSFHPHPLTLDESKQMFMCDGCEALCTCSLYTCELCSFNLCGRCATLDNETQQVLKTKTTISHFSHSCQLTQCKVNILQRDPKFKETCAACRQRLCGITYACIDCEFFLHESCLKDMLEEVQSSSFHPQHPLRTHAVLNYGVTYTCGVCKEIIKGLLFICLQCDFDVHYSCSKYQFREVKHGFHADHRLLHLGKGLFGDESPLCSACDQACENTLWCCFECRLYVHLECIPLPSVVKHKRHLHPLALTTVTEDDSGDYYCDTCETRRNPEHDVYHCKECNYISHIDCVISEVEPLDQVLQSLTPRLKGN